MLGDDQSLAVEVGPERAVPSVAVAEAAHLEQVVAAEEAEAGERRREDRRSVRSATSATGHSSPCGGRLAQ